jgi:hypothetical protein
MRFLTQRQHRRTCTTLLLLLLLLLKKKQVLFLEQLNFLVLQSSFVNCQVLQSSFGCRPIIVRCTCEIVMGEALVQVVDVSLYLLDLLLCRHGFCCQRCQIINHFAVCKLLRGAAKTQLGGRKRRWPPENPTVCCAESAFRHASRRISLGRCIDCILTWRICICFEVHGRTAEQSLQTAWRSDIASLLLPACPVCVLLPSTQHHCLVGHKLHQWPKK